MKIIKGLVSAIVLIAFVIGVPAILIIVAGNPIPSFEVIQGLFSRPDYGGQFLFGTLVPIIIWIWWATFVWSLAIEIPAAIKGIHAPRIGAISFQQAMAGALVAAVVALFTLGSVATAPQAMAVDAPPTTISQTQNTEAPTATTATAGPSTTIAQGPSYTVQEGDSLWKIAQATLGDGAKAQQIADLNYGVAQADGGQLTNAHWITPGWTLTLPEAATTPAGTYIVQAGDTLSGIAQAALGDASLADQIFKASTTITQPGGEVLTNPDLIKPGWTLNLTTTTTSTTNGAGGAIGASETNSNSEVAPEAPAPPQVPEPAAAAPTAPAQTPAAPATTIPGVSATAEPPQQNAPAQEQQGQETAPEAAEAPTLDLATIGGLGAVISGSILSILGFMRLRQRRRRRPGRAISMPTGESAVMEQQLRAVADDDAVETLDDAMRYLAVWAQDHGQPLPKMFSARITPSSLGLFLSEPADLPAPSREIPKPTTAPYG